MGSMLIDTNLLGIKYVFMYSLCVLHPNDLTVFIYEVRVDSCMCVFPVIRSLLIKQNVFPLKATAGTEKGLLTGEAVFSEYFAEEHH